MHRPVSHRRLTPWTWLVLLLVLLQVLGPLVHGHFGASRLAGWHVHLSKAPTYQAPRSAEAAAAVPSSPGDASEGAAVSVEPGLRAVFASPAIFLALAPAFFAVLALLPGLYLAATARRAARVRRVLFTPRSRPPNAPPPALAPPVFS
ncbi:hypothetical protein [Variovorax terrae]|uniref:Uncharacterized protein n=1 Tax=Variovorax terrae TaxID=2923278 RepID=A0A9X1W3C5_9BURK|nr:hypothetical protein [Variovorax terrae]MCJ0765158.1 hypothetical protein [Variovorax terrae]